MECLQESKCVVSTAFRNEIEATSSPIPPPSLGVAAHGTTNKKGNGQARA